MKLYIHQFFGWLLETRYSKTEVLESIRSFICSEKETKGVGFRDYNS